MVGFFRRFGRYGRRSGCFVNGVSEVCGGAGRTNATTTITLVHSRKGGRDVVDLETRDRLFCHVLLLRVFTAVHTALDAEICGSSGPQ